MSRTTFHRLLGLYRNTLKRLPLAHRLAYFVAERVALPLLEHYYRFWTIPDDPVYFRLELILRRYEPETVAFFRQHIKPGMTVLDIGAHIGYYTRLFSQLVGPLGTVIAFEPHPIHFQYLQMNCGDAGNVILVNKAVGDQSRTVTLYDALPESGGVSIGLCREKREYVWSKMAHELSKRSREGLPIRTFTAEMVPLDEALGQMGITCFDVMKIDIEGAEVMALSGAKQLLASSNGFIVFELAPTNLRELGTSPYNLLHLLQHHGFTKIGIIEDGGKVNDLSPDAMKRLIAELEAEFSRVNCVAWKEQ